MVAAPLPENERARLAAVKELGWLDTPPDRHLDDLVAMVARRLRVPAAAISLIDRERQWLKARVGIDIRQTPRDVAFCAHAILRAEPTVVADASLDERFADNPFVVEPPRIRFFAGIPLTTPDGYAVGTLCAFDYVPRQMSRHELATMAGIARAVIGQIAVQREVQSANRAHFAYERQ